MMDLFEARIQEPPIAVGDSDIKALVRHRDDYRCVECGMTAAEHLDRYSKNLDVHRLSPGGTYTVAGCITLCRACHGKHPKSSVGSNPSGAKMVAIPGDLSGRFRKYAQQHGMTFCKALEFMVQNHLKSSHRWPADPDTE